MIACICRACESEDPGEEGGRMDGGCELGGAGGVRVGGRVGQRGKADSAAEETGQASCTVWIGGLLGLRGTFHNSARH